MPANITNVSFTFHDERKREEYGPMKKAEATITAAVADGEDGTVVLDTIAFIATNKVRAALSIEGATMPTAEPSTEAAGRPAAVSPPPPAEQAAAGSPTPAPPTHIRRTTDEKARGLTPAQAAAERAARAGGSRGSTAEEAAAERIVADDGAVIKDRHAEPQPEPGSEAWEDQQQAKAEGAEWDAPAPVVISDAELNAACAAAAQKCGDPTKVRSLKEPYNPNPGQPFTFTQIPQQHRAEVLEKLAAL